MIDTAVILAAGMGTRLRNVLKDVPKGFLEIEENSLVKLSVMNLLKSGITKIIIATGYLSKHYDNFAKEYNCVRLVNNINYAHSGSMYSLYCVKELIHNDFILLESDLIYENRAIEELIHFKKENAILISGLTNSGDEVYVETKNDKIYNMSKNKRTLNEISGELVGISKISVGMFQQMISISKIFFKKDLNLDYEDCIISTASKYPVYYLKIDNLIWAEIDDEIHLNRVKNVIYPYIKRIDNEKN